MCVELGGVLRFGSILLCRMSTRVASRIDPEAVTEYADGPKEGALVLLIRELDHRSRQTPKTIICGSGG